MMRPDFDAGARGRGQTAATDLDPKTGGRRICSAASMLSTCLEQQGSAHCGAGDKSRLLVDAPVEAGCPLHPRQHGPLPFATWPTMPRHAHTRAGRGCDPGSPCTPGTPRPHEQKTMPLPREALADGFERWSVLMSGRRRHPPSDVRQQLVLFGSTMVLSPILPALIGDTPMLSAASCTAAAHQRPLPNTFTPSWSLMY